MFATCLAVSSLFAALLQVPPAPAPTPAVPSEQQVWIADFDEAAKLAKEKGKDLFVDFTGSGWCGWCTRLHDEVFVHEEFLKAAEQRYVLVALDFQNTGESKTNAPNPERNNELRDRYQVQGFPTILLLTPDGDLFGRTGYQEGGPAKYVELVNTLHETGKKALAEVAELVAKFEAAKGEEKEKVVDAAMSKLEELGPGSPFAAKLAPVVRAAFTLDPDNKQGRKIKAVAALLKAGLEDDEVLELGAALDPKNEQGVLERVVVARCRRVRGPAELETMIKAIEELDAFGPLKSKDVAIPIYLNAAFWSHQFLQKPDDAKKYAQKAKDLGVDNPRALELINRILGS